MWVLDQTLLQIMNHHAVRLFATRSQRVFGGTSAPSMGASGVFLTARPGLLACLRWSRLHRRVAQGEETCQLASSTG